MDEQTEFEIEAAILRHLPDYLRECTEVQNIGLMNLAGFCRNCLSSSYLAQAESLGVEIDDAKAREFIYGMPYPEWKATCHRDATAEQQARTAAWHQRQ